MEEAFGTLHRSHASTVGVPQHLPSFAGILVEREVRELSRFVHAPAHPYVVLVGGAKVADKLPLLTSFLGRADTLLIGGARVPLPEGPGRKARSHGSRDRPRARYLGVPRERPEKWDPGDFSPRCRRRTSQSPVPRSPGPSRRSLGTVLSGTSALATRRQFAEALTSAQLVLWNGPLGMAEDPRFAAGTREVLSALAGGSGYHVCAGGDSARIAQDLGVTNVFQYVSTGGGAALEFVRGGDLPGLSVLPDA